MYVNAAFTTNETDAWAFVAERGFGAIVAIDRGTPVSAHVPLLVTSDPSLGAAVAHTATALRRVEFHVARTNPIHGIIAASPRVLLTVTGPDAYISPDWYVSADQVPTWNYIAAHLTGTARAMAPEQAHDHVERMSLAFERRLLPKKPWSTSKMSERRRAMMLAAIVPIEIEIERIECAFKLSQNKGLTDRLEASRMLDWRGSPNERGMAAAMRAHLKLPVAETLAAKTEAV